MTKITNIAISGANGRMGRELLEACLNDEHFRLVAALVRNQSRYIDQNISELVNNISSHIRCSDQSNYLNADVDVDVDVDVVIDFTLPENTLANLQLCIAAKCALVIGTTGFNAEQQRLIIEAATQIPILQASNMSIGVNLTLALLKQAAKVLGEDAEVKLTETHHIHKIDSPSGTAITMAEVIANSIGKNVADCVEINSIREGEVVGDHRVNFRMYDETIEITHKAGSRQIFAKGALKAAGWIKDKPPGLYSMDDVLGLID